MSPTREPQGKRLWLIYFPRAAHHLFMRMFSGHKDLEMIEVLAHFEPSVASTILLSGNTRLDDVKDDCERLRSLQQTGYQDWMEHLEKLEKGGKRVLNSFSVAFHISPALHNQFLHQQGRENGRIDQKPSDSTPSSREYWQIRPQETTPHNPTIFPDSLLRSHIPILLIRNPIRAFPSTVRAGTMFFKSDVGAVFMNLILRYRWHVMLFEWYKNDPDAAEPLILDADDLMYNPDAVSDLCSRAGLDPGQIRYEWSSQKVSVTYDREEIFQTVLAESTGIVDGKGSGGLKVETEMVKWVEEFGSERAQLLRRLVEDAMPDYDYLKKRSVGAMV